MTNEIPVIPVSHAHWEVCEMIASFQEVGTQSQL
jgi:hypothetical protein